MNDDLTAKELASQLIEGTTKLEGFTETLAKAGEGCKEDIRELVKDIFTELPEKERKRLLLLYQVHHRHGEEWYEIAEDLLEEHPGLIDLELEDFEAWIQRMIDTQDW